MRKYWEANTQCTAKGPLPTVSGRQMTVHIVRHGRPGITHRIFQKAEDPQPGPVASTFSLKIDMVST